MNFDQMKQVVAALDGQTLSAHGYFDMEHDILYIPWSEPKGEVAEKLEAAGCHWEEDVESWAHF
jgi:hypothetical protein